MDELKKTYPWITECVPCPGNPVITEWTKGRVQKRRILMNTKFVWALILAIIGLYLTGCSVFMAATQPDKKDIGLFKIGTPRSMLLAEFGLPAVAEERDGKKYKIYVFTQGYSSGAKAGRAVFHGAADVLTLGLWEVIGTPTEGVFDGTEMGYEVSYDENNRIDQAVLLKKK